MRRNLTLVARGISFLLTVNWILLLSGTTFAATYYIDCVAGLDSNSGTSKSSPWLHHPYMTGWSGKYTHAAGDHFIFKGGVVCPVGYLPLTLAAGGASGNSDFYGADVTWYAGGGWSRPIFDGNQTGPGGAGTSMFQGGSYDYWTVDSIEFRNQGLPSNGFNYAVHGTGTGLTVNNIYAHAWHLTAVCGDSDAKQGGVYLQTSTVTDFSNVLSNSIINGADVTDSNGPVYLGGAYQGQTAFGNTFHDIPNGMVGNHVHAYNNTIYNIVASCDSGQHENAIENVGDNSVRNEIYNNVIHGVAAGVVILVAGNTDFYNNVIYDNSPYDIQIDTNGGGDSSANAVIYNNTLQGTGGLIRVVNRGTTLGSLTLQNNHYITNLGSNPACYNNPGGGCSNVTTVVDHYGSADTVTMTNATASSQGYTSSETPPYSPTSGSNGTVGAGLNLTSLCSTLSALCADILGVSRPSSGVWEAGAYLFTGAGAPNPPTLQQAIPH